MDQIKVKEQTIRRLKKKVRFSKTNKVILTDNAVQDIKEDVLYMSGNTIMINGLDTLTCDSMVYWSKMDSGYAIGNVRYVQPKKWRQLTTDIFHYWQTKGYRGSSFITKGYTQVIEPDQLITANEISYDDDKQMMKLTDNASVKKPTRGIFGDEMNIQYEDSLIKEINITKNAFAYNDLNVKIEKNGPLRQFRDEMSSREMIAHFIEDDITKLELMHMATTLYNVINDSLIVGNNEASGDSIFIDFTDGNIKRIQVVGGALGEFKPEGNNSKIDTTILYGANYLDYHIDDEKTLLSDNAYVEYQNTTLSAGKIVVDWQTNILDAVKVNEKYPMIKTWGEAPMKGNSMVFDLVAKHGRIDQGRTSFNQSFYHGKEVFRDDPNIFHVEKSKYTSCELDDPHFYLGSRKMKMLPGNKVIAKPLWLHIYDFPVIGLPLAVFPSKGGNRQSGWIMPSFDSNHARGTGLRKLGYYWAPNDYLDGTILIDIFDKDGIYIDTPLNYKKRAGTRWYNFSYNGHLNGSFDRWISDDSEEIMNLINDSDKINEKLTLDWYHRQKFDPTQAITINYHYVSNKDVYQNERILDRKNQLKQNLISSFSYSKNWKNSSFGINYSEERNLGIENKSPESVILKNNRYIFYKSQDGPRINYYIGSQKIFGLGNNWYNSLTSSYSMNARQKKVDYWLIKQDNTSWAKRDSSFITDGHVQQNFSLSAPTTFFRWFSLNPKLSLREDWIFNYNKKNEGGEEIPEEGFKRRLTWGSSISASTKIYGLFPIIIGRISSLRHVITPSLSFTYRPDFSNPKFGGNLYFQKLESGELYDYFNKTPVGATSTTETQIYRLSVNNIFQAKIRKEKEGYDKENFLTFNSSISYNPLKTSEKLSEMASNVRVKNLSGDDLFRMKMSHNFYLSDDGEKLIDLWEGELPRLTSMNISTNMNFKLFGVPISDVEKKSTLGNIENIEDEFYSIGDGTKSNRGDQKVWGSKLSFQYSTKWTSEKENWEDKISLAMNNTINISKEWALSYKANFNIQEKQLTYHNFSFFRPLHCWEFHFEYYPISDRYSLRINVKNTDLQDIKIISSSPYP